jgi:hypothetical protein
MHVSAKTWQCHETCWFSPVGVVRMHIPCHTPWRAGVKKNTLPLHTSASHAVTGSVELSDTVLHNSNSLAVTCIGVFKYVVIAHLKVIRQRGALAI